MFTIEDPYDDDPRAYSRAYPHDYPGDDLDRLTHLVLVDGRLVDTWSEPVIGTRWEPHARRFDQELRRVVEPPPKPPHQRVLEWLDAAVGGRSALEALDDAPLVEDGLDLPETPEQHQRERLEAVAELLDAVAERCFEVEMSFAFRRALLRLWAEDPETVTGIRSAALVASGICWAVGKANGCFRPSGDLTMGRVQEALAVSTSLGGPGEKVRSALHGFRGLKLDSRGPWRPTGVPNLLPLGHADLLVASTRGSLVRLRDRATAARASDADFYRAG